MRTANGVARTRQSLAPNVAQFAAVRTQHFDCLADGLARHLVCVVAQFGRRLDQSLATVFRLLETLAPDCADPVAERLEALRTYEQNTFSLSVLAVLAHRRLSDRSGTVAGLPTLVVFLAPPRLRNRRCRARLRTQPLPLRACRG